jgi:hypothetical protein
MLPGKPAGSTIEQRDGNDGTVLAWSYPSDEVGRWFGAAFITFWLCVWTFAGLAALGVLILGDNGILADLFMLLWLGGWAFGEVTALLMLWNLLLPSRPESVTLGLATFRYDPGHSPACVTSRGKYPSWGTPPHHIPRCDLVPFVLDRVGERQRLTFDHGVNRVEIGACLREPEREWLYAVLESWRQRR